MPFIRAVRTDPPGTRTENVREVRYSITTTGPLRALTRAGVHRRIVAGERFRTYDEVNGHQADVVARTTPGGTRYITTVANGRETDNLLRLPRY